MSIEEIKKEEEQQQAQALTDEELEGAAGGWLPKRPSFTGLPVICPKCGYDLKPQGGMIEENKYRCKQCRQWFIARRRGNQCIDHP